jgi:predicted O-methyltransferase YrrM
MSSRTLSITPALEAYLLEVGVQEPEALRALREETAHLPGAQMQIGPDQGRFMRWLVELVAAKRCLEIGVFTGYSSTAVALGMADDGRLIACDIDPKVTEVAKRCWQRAGVGHKIQLELRPALETLRMLTAGGQAGFFDFVFIDADKEAYDEYYEACLVLLRSGGLLLIDNTLWSGKVVEPHQNDAATQAIVALNRKIAGDRRVSACLLPIGDGLTLLRKR